MTKAEQRTKRLMKRETEQAAASAAYWAEHNAARIYTSTVGQHFGTVATVNRHGRDVHTTRVYPYGFTGAAVEAAEAWCREQGFEVAST